MKNIRVGLGVVFLVFGTTQATQLSRAGDLTLTVTPAVLGLRALDPMFLKVTLDNRGEFPATLRVPLGDRFGSVRLEMRHVGKPEYMRVRTKFSGLKGGEFPLTAIPPGGSAISYEVLFASSKSAVFEEAGVYELRATADIGGSKVVSEAVTVTVEGISDAERRTIEDANAILFEAIGTGVSDYVDMGEIASIERSLGKSRLKETLQWILAVRAITDATDDTDRGSALATLKTLRGRMDPVTAEVVDRVLRKRSVSLDSAAGAQDKATGDTGDR